MDSPATQSQKRLAHLLTRSRSRRSGFRGTPTHPRPRPTPRPRTSSHPRPYGAGVAIRVSEDTGRPPPGRRTRTLRRRKTRRAGRARLAWPPLRMNLRRPGREGHGILRARRKRPSGAARVLVVQKHQPRMGGPDPRSKEEEEEEEDIQE